ncbi:hypothetical protein BJY59DRAFT_19021 [Rhodotorula toruloides]
MAGSAGAKWRARCGCTSPLSPRNRGQSRHTTLRLLEGIKTFTPLKWVEAHACRAGRQRHALNSVLAYLNGSLAPVTLTSRSPFDSARWLLPFLLPNTSLDSLTMTKTLEHSALFGSSSQIGSAIPDAFLAPATPRSSSSETELRLAFSAGAVRSACLSYWRESCPDRLLAQSRLAFSARRLPPTQHSTSCVERSHSAGQSISCISQPASPSSSTSSAKKKLTSSSPMPV